MKSEWFLVQREIELGDSEVRVFSSRQKVGAYVIAALSGNLPLFGSKSKMRSFIEGGVNHTAIYCHGGTGRGNLFRISKMDKEPE